MARKVKNSQLTNFLTYKMHKQDLVSLAENVFKIGNLPEFIDLRYVNKNLVSKGAVAFFEDEVLGILALPFENIGTLDVYGRPMKIRVYGESGYTKILNPKEYVIMYDNNSYYSIYTHILQYAERLGICDRTIDINILQQRTPRIWKTQNGNETTIKNLINEVDSNCETVVTYDTLDINDTNVVLAPAPFIADKVSDIKNKIWNEFLRFIGITNLTWQKKERQIKDEINALQGGTIASRFSRYEPRKKAIEEINKKWNLNLTLEYYDGIPTTETTEEFNGGDYNDDF